MYIEFREAMTCFHLGDKNVADTRCLSNKEQFQTQ